MLAPILSALGVSALLLLAFGDMLGLPAPLVRLLSLGILGFIALGTVLTQATARFSRFLGGDEGARAPGAGVVAILLAGGTLLTLMLAAGLPAALAGFCFLMSFLLALPVFKAPLPDAEPGFRDVALVRALGGGLLALLLLDAVFPILISRTDQFIPLSTVNIRGLALALIGVPVIFGGMAGLAALAALVLLLALVFVLGPLVIELGLGLRGSEGIAGLGLKPDLPGLPAGNMRLLLLEPVALGIALALATRQGRGSLTLKGRISRPILGLFLGAGLIACGLALWLAMNHILTHELAARPISSWPLWAFDEAIRGWITLCGQPIASYAETARSCAQQGVAFSGPLSPDSALMLPGLAIARGWPVLFGILPNFIILLTLALTAAMLLHAAISAWGSLWALIRQKQMALRSQRLALMRCLALLFLALIGTGALAFLPSPARQVLLIGALLLIGLGEFATGIRRLQHWLQRRAVLPANALVSIPEAA